MNDKTPWSSASSRLAPVRLVALALLWLVLLLSAHSIAPQAVAAGPAVSNPATARFVLAIGNNVGLSNEAALRFAADDASAVASTFRRVGGVSAKRIVVVTDGSLEEVRAAFRRLAKMVRSAGGDSEAVVYFSGHGSEKQLHIQGKRIAVAEVKALLARVPARARLLLLDACRSGGRAKGLRKGPRFDIRLEQANLKGPTGTVVVRSSSPGEAAQESDELRSAVFTHYFLGGLRGPADRDRSGTVTLAEAYAHAYHRTLIRTATAGAAPTHATQSLAIDSAGGWVLSRPRRARSTVILPAAPDARFLIYQAATHRVFAEVWGKTGQVVSVALPKGRFVIHLRSASDNAVAEVHLPYGGTRSVARADFSSRPIAQLAQKGGGVVVRPHELEVNYSLGIHSLGAALQHSIGVRYGYRAWPTLILNLRIMATATAFEHGSNQVIDRALGGAIGLEGRVPLTEGVELRLGGVLGAYYLSRAQTDNRVSKALVYASEGVAPTVGIFAGPQITLSRQLWLRIGLRGDALFTLEREPLAEVWRTRWSGGFSVGMGGAF